MTPYEFGDLLLLNAFPYSNQAQTKKRPALVLADTGDQDILVARVTSEDPRDNYDIALSSWKENGLLLPSSLRLSKIVTLSKRLVVKKLGKLGSPDRRKVRSLLKKIFDL